MLRSSMKLTAVKSTRINRENRGRGELHTGGDGEEKRRQNGNCRRFENDISPDRVRTTSVVVAAIQRRGCARPIVYHSAIQIYYSLLENTVNAGQ